MCMCVCVCLCAGGVFTLCFAPTIDLCLDLVPSSVVNTPVCKKKSVNQIPCFRIHGFANS